MEDNKPLAIIRKKLRERMNDLADTVAGGGAKDFGDYRNLCGQIHGLAVAEREILDIQSALEQSKDD